ncbi:MAG: hypothetical protein RQ760_08810 [Sedimentisphaerales bacterium]|nr:hypothetical protein [Sedimentisphaerales bacterium]
MASMSFYVSVSGKDQWSGRSVSPNGDLSDGPFSTLQRARDAIRQLKMSEGLPEGGVIVWITEGTYCLEQGLKLTAEDSGETARPIIYHARPNEQVRITGGRTITGWQKIIAPAVLDRLQQTARVSVVQADLKAQRITDFGKLRSRGFARSASPAALEVFFQDDPMILARWPNEGFLKIVGYPNSVGDDHGGTIGQLDAGFNYETDRPDKWADTNDI